ncbi:iron-sulfur cluster assembly scaffold protein [Oceanispirochaeta sp.]|jgi:NifU-like protein|uniref:iron-sulfur cluster assembly scaffold protein n=1 Tax=Oceanispirochaeta sp. TaxID=2035350 RepID=UPI00260A80DF|nr:iron-sulfur cluster assembly scaffold protein [Oceanispirochaeta sp.]MDA3957164.1 iron-sulfur cluster assembly scaffold protein [Oceanispirochaeta sp.]
MAKNDLLGGSLWDNYSNKVADRMDHPTYLGLITEAEAEALNARLVIADWGAESCGDAVRLYWAVDKVSDRIVKASFKSFGCGTAIASSDMMVELCIGKTVDEVLEITNLDVEKSLRDDPDTPAVPPQKMHCSVMAYDVIKQAAAIYKGVEKGILDDDEMVCECARVTLKTIQEVIRINDLTTVEEITDYTKAGAFCKSCIRPGGHEQKKYYLVDILKETRAQMDREVEQKKELPFSSRSSFQKMRMIENHFDAEIRPLLHKDGGDVVILDIKDQGESTLVSISYKGACMGCGSALTGTLSFIEQGLKDHVDESIRVSVE